LLPDVLCGVATGLALVGGAFALRAAARRGWRRGLRAAYVVMFGYAALLILGAIVGLFGGHGIGLWYGLGAAGIAGVIALSLNGPQLWQDGREAEQRRMAAHDL
jgi:hypothetical protein